MRGLIERQFSDPAFSVKVSNNRSKVRENAVLETRRARFLWPWLYTTTAALSNWLPSARMTRATTSTGFGVLTARENRQSTPNAI